MFRFAIPIFAVLFASIAEAQAAVENYRCRDGNETIFVSLNVETLVVTVRNKDVVMRVPVRETQRPAQNWRQYTAENLFSLTFANGLAPIFHFNSDMTCALSE